MKPYLLYEQNNEKQNNMILMKKCHNENDLIQDLNLNEIFDVMSQNDAFLYDTVKSVMLNSLTDIPTIIYRQNILKDCLNNKNIIRDFLNITSSALKEAAYYKEYTQTSFAKIIPVSVRLFNSVGLLDLLVKKLENLKSSVRVAEKTFQSKGLTTFCSRFEILMTEVFFTKVKEYIGDLKSLTEDGNMVIGSCIGNGLKGANHVLRKISRDVNKNNAKKILHKNLPCSIIPLNNSSIVNSAKEIEDAALVHILRAINQFTSSIIHFFEALRFETGFYVGCMNLHDTLLKIGVVTSFPIPEDMDKTTLIFNSLYDAGMAIENKNIPVSNDLYARNKTLFIITGANQGGKSTFLRSIGLAQIFMQCGAFVPASSYYSNVCDCIFTHFTREEDAGMNSGKLDEELSRMNNIVNRITPHSLLLMNEPFATTTERDGSRIAADMVTAFYELGIKVLLVTHLYEFPSLIYNMKLEKAVYLRAERNEDGSRSFSIKEGKPLQTSFGEDLFRVTVGTVIKADNNQQLFEALMPDGV